MGYVPGAGATKSMVTCSPPRGTFLSDFELLDLDAVHAVGRFDHETNPLALGDFDTRGLKGKTFRHDFEGMRGS